MDYQWQTHGHERVKRILDLQQQANQVPHAYLFSGPNGIGKKMLALEFAARLQNRDSLKSHPDVHLLDAESSSGVESIRQFVHRLTTKPFVGPFTIGLIDNAEQLTREAANALLKTLEEPKSSVVIFLIASGNSVLPTIASRCQTFSFNRFTPKQLNEFVVANQVETGADLLKLCAGRPGLLMRLREDSEYAERVQNLVGQFSSLRTQSLSSTLPMLSMLAEKESKDLAEGLSLWLDIEPATQLSSSLVEKVLAVIVALGQSANKKLALQQLILN